MVLTVESDKIVFSGFNAHSSYLVWKEKQCMQLMFRFQFEFPVLVCTSHISPAFYRQIYLQTAGRITFLCLHDYF